jgi:hypothetical protein
MSTNVKPQARSETPVMQPLTCGARRRPPLGVSPAAISHSDLRDRLLSCAG